MVEGHTSIHEPVGRTISTVAALALDLVYVASYLTWMCTRPRGVMCQSASWGCRGKESFEWDIH
jgi:hypothetical protein